MKSVVNWVSIAWGFCTSNEMIICLLRCSSMLTLIYAVLVYPRCTSIPIYSHVSSFFCLVTP